MNTRNLLTFVAMAVLVGAIVSMTTSGVFAQSNNSQDDGNYNGSLIDRIMAQQGGNDNENDDHAGDEEDCAEDEDEEGEEDDADEVEDEDEEGDVDEVDDEECGAEDDQGEGEKKFTSSFMTENCTFASTGTNPFFILEPGYQSVLVGEEEGAEIQLVITVLNETKVVNGTETRIVEERETEDGELVEISRNFFAICEETNSVFYFGEEVDDYEGGEIVGHSGAWLAGEGDSRPGIFMPGTVLLGARYYQEIAPDVALDRAEIVELDGELEVPAGSFDNVLVVVESTPLEPDVEELNYYAAGVGVLQDEFVKLVEYGFVE